MPALSLVKVRKGRKFHLARDYLDALEVWLSHSLGMRAIVDRFLRDTCQGDLADADELEDDFVAIANQGGVHQL